jgi:hypothetical protein
VVAAMLLDTAVREAVGRGMHLYAAIPGASQVAIHVLREWGFTITRDDLRMRLELATTNAPSPTQSDWNYAMLSAMVG